MIKYVVNSGSIRKSPDKGKSFFQEIVRDLGPQPRILFCFFAKARSRWESEYPKHVSIVQELLGDDIRPTFDLAFPKTFAKQINAADAIYLHGGDDYLLLSWLREFDLPKLWEGKIVATNSASSDALASHFWAVDWRECMDGLGLLPMKFISHYEGWSSEGDPRGLIDWAKAKAELASYADPTLPIYALREGEFEVFHR